MHCSSETCAVDNKRAKSVRRAKTRPHAYEEHERNHKPATLTNGRDEISVVALRRRVSAATKRRCRLPRYVRKTICECTRIRFYTEHNSVPRLPCRTRDELSFWRATLDQFDFKKILAWYCLGHKWLFELVNSSRTLRICVVFLTEHLKSSSVCIRSWFTIHEKYNKKSCSHTHTHMCAHTHTHTPTCTHI